MFFILPRTSYWTSQEGTDGQRWYTPHFIATTGRWSLTVHLSYQAAFFVIVDGMDTI